MKQAHNELLNTPLQDWPLSALEEHLAYLREVASFDHLHSIKLIDDCLKLEAYIDYKKASQTLDNPPSDMV